MARQIPPDRFQALHAVTTELLIAQGYGRMQMDDVAKALGVAKGTLYQYVESKQALFDFVLRHTLPGATIEVPASLPLRTPPPASTLRFVREQIEREGQLPRLAAALAGATPADPAGELDEIVSELFELLSLHRVGIKLLERCSRDYPELHAIWHAGGRYSVVDLFSELVDSRIQAGCYAPVPDARVTARVLIELVTTWAVHIHWDPAPQGIDEAAALETVKRFARGGLLHPEPAPR